MWIIYDFYIFLDLVEYTRSRVSLTYFHMYFHFYLCPAGLEPPSGARNNDKIYVKIRKKTWCGVIDHIQNYFISWTVYCFWLTIYGYNSIGLNFISLNICKFTLLHKSLNTLLCWIGSRPFFFAKLWDSSTMLPVISICRR